MSDTETPRQWKVIKLPTQHDYANPGDLWRSIDITPVDSDEPLRDDYTGKIIEDY